MSRKKDKKDIRWVRNTVAFAKLFVLGIILIGIPLILILFYRDTLLSTDFWSQLPDRLARHSLISFLVLIVLQAIQIIICILPGQPIQLASSYMYGVMYFHYRCDYRLPDYVPAGSFPGCGCHAYHLWGREGSELHEEAEQRKGTDHRVFDLFGSGNSKGFDELHRGNFQH